MEQDKQEFRMPTEKKLYIEKSVIEKMISFIQDTRFTPESGGCLIGKYRSSGNIDIIDCTVPYPKDNRNIVKFLRKDKKHLEYIEKIKESSNGFIGYIGNWHTHPQDIPEPSIVDIISWQNSLVKETEEFPLIFIILGRKKLNIWYAHPKDRKIIKITNE